MLVHVHAAGASKGWIFGMIALWWSSFSVIRALTALASFCISAGSFLFVNSIQNDEDKGSIWPRALGDWAVAGLVGAATTALLERYFHYSIGAELPGCYGIFRPKFFFCLTTHARFIPTHHKFKYPLLYVGIPLGMKGGIGNLLSVKPSESEINNGDTGLKMPWSFFTVDPGRYMNPELPFDKKLENVIKGHGLNPKDYPHGYFVTTPAFFGYSFNPVSYYYLYNSAQELKLIVLEVLNTFGEKHVYLLRSDDPRNPRPRKGYAFAGTMEKVFHISTFNHRSGSYVIHVRDPLLPDNKVDVHMMVKNEEGQKSMFARAFSTAESFDALSGKTWYGWWIALTWGLNSFLALPETFIEAWKLYRKGTKTHIRPEPFDGSIKRKATGAEKEMGALFIAFLRARVQKLGAALEVKVTLPESDPRKTPLEFVFLNYGNCMEEIRKLHIRILNPRFFLRFFANQDPLHAIWMDYTTSEPEFRPVVIESGEVEWFKSLFSSSKTGHATINSWTWRLISRLRTWKTEKELTSTSTKVELQSPTLHESTYLNIMDDFYLVQNAASSDLTSMYKWNVLHAVLADVIGFGDASNLELYAAIIKGGFVATIAMITNIFVVLRLS